MTRRFYETEVSIRTRTTTDRDFCTKIAGTNFRRRYRSTKPMTVFEAEATARPATHELGFSIVDQNYPTLARLVFEINSYSEQMAGLHTCAHKTVRMVH